MFLTYSSKERSGMSLAVLKKALAAGFLALAAPVFLALGLTSPEAAFLLSLKEPEALVPLVCTRVRLLTRLLSPSWMQLLFFSMS